MNAKKSQSRGRGPLISITVQRRPRRRGGVLRGLVGLVLAITKPEPIAKYGGGSGSRSSSSSKASQGRGAPIRSASWQGPDPTSTDRPVWARHGLPSPQEWEDRCAAWDAERAAEGFDPEAMADEFGPDGEGPDDEGPDGEGMEDGGSDPSGVEAGAV